MNVLRAFPLVALLLPCFAQQDSAPNSPEYFEKYVRPILAERCQGCHNPKAHKSGLDLTTGEGFRKGADAGPLVDREKPAESRIVKAVSYLERVKMPPTGKIKDSEIATIAEWVKAGAVWPGVDPKLVSETKAAPAPGKKFTEGQRKFWSFQPRKSVEPPTVKNSAWVANPVDAFILAKLEAKNLVPAHPADKPTLLRRVTLDLTGVPPTEKEIADFAADSSPHAYERAIDRLLASRRYGEKWGRHWLDVARYADSTGADEDHRYPDAWKYRDYVIDSFNRDLPYNRFVVEQLAGDLLPPEGDDARVGVNRRGIVATGFLAIGPRLIAEQDKKKMFYDFVDEQIATTSRAFLGLTVDCARCHDHKFDPILQKDYYSMASIFASTKSFAKLEGTVSQMYRPPLVPKAEFDTWQEAQKKVTAKKVSMDLIHQEQASIRVAGLEGRIADYLVAAQTGASPPDLDAEILKKWVAYLKSDEVRPHMMRWQAAEPEELREVARSYQTEFHTSYIAYNKAFEAWKKKVEKAMMDGLPGPDKPSFDETKNRFFEEVYLKKDGPFGMAPDQREKTYPADVQTKLAGLKTEWEALTKASPPEPDLAIGVSEGDPVTQHLFVRGDAHTEGEVVAKQFPVILAGDSQSPIANGSGRMELARWMTDPNNPLVARVMTNRIWQWHFGEGLVRTPSNFGLLGEKPTHPELLDWLSNRFIDDGWSVKKMHKLLLLSNTYRQSSAIAKDQFDKDPGNRLWSHYQRRRMDVEEIRDSMLAIDGSMDWTMGGTLQKGTGTDGENASGRMSIDPATSKRRTVYLPLRRSNLPSLLNLFDFGDGTTSNEARSSTNVAPQALFAMNSPFINDRATALAEKTPRDNLDQAVRSAFVKVLNRGARDPEVRDLDAYMKKFPGESDFTRWRSLYRILLASNEFLYVD